MSLSILNGSVGDERERQLSPYLNSEPNIRLSARPSHSAVYEKQVILDTCPGVTALSVYLGPFYVPTPACDFRRYRDRNRIERMFGFLKQFRRVATRYDKTALSFASFLNLAAIRMWLSNFVKVT